MCDALRRGARAIGLGTPPGHTLGHLSHPKTAHGRFLPMPVCRYHLPPTHSPVVTEISVVFSNIVWVMHKLRADAISRRVVGCALAARAAAFIVFRLTSLPAALLYTYRAERNIQSNSVYGVSQTGKHGISQKNGVLKAESARAKVLQVIWEKVKRLPLSVSVPSIVNMLVLGVCETLKSSYPAFTCAGSECILDPDDGCRILSPRFPAACQG